MNIIAIFQKRTNKAFMTSLELVPEVVEGEPVFQSAYSQDANMFDVKAVSCTQAVFDKIKDLAGTRQAPALIADAAAPKYENRINCFIEKDSLKIT